MGDDGIVHGEYRTEVAIIGAGYTGLSAAYHFSDAGGEPPMVLEAKSAGWGCSGRNGGLVRPALGRVPYKDWLSRWGRRHAESLFQEAMEAVTLTHHLATSGAIDCELTPFGVLKIAHSSSALPGLETEVRVLADTFGVAAELVDASALSAHYFHSNEAYGALRLPHAFSLNPLRYALNLCALARMSGATVHSGSPIIDWQKRSDSHVLTTPNAVVRARKVIIATNGYGAENLHAELRGALLPMLSNIIVTRQLTAQEREASGFYTHQAAFDTRRILNYYRLLPDGRVLFGSRGPLRDTARSRRHHRARLHASMVRKFPALRHVDIDYYWSGWVALPYDFTPHIGLSRHDPTVAFGVGYSGSGVAAATYAGKLLAQIVSGNANAHPILGSSPPRYPLAPLRGLAQALAVGWFQFLDDGKPW